MIGDNIKKLRETLGITQQKFAERIGLKQNSIALIEGNKRNISQQALLAISREFGVRLEWLETGEGEMYTERDTSILAQLEASGSLTPKGRELIEIYLRMPPATQDLIAEAIAAAARLYPRKESSEPLKQDDGLTKVEVYEEIGMTPQRQKPDSELTRAEKHALLDAELDKQEAAEKRATATSSVSITSSG